jgi:hypothetical protein
MNLVEARSLRSHIHKWIRVGIRIVTKALEVTLLDLESSAHLCQWQLDFIQQIPRLIQSLLAQHLHSSFPLTHVKDEPTLCLRFLLVGWLMHSCSTVSVVMNYSTDQLLNHSNRWRRRTLLFLFITLINLGHEFPSFLSNCLHSVIWYKSINLTLLLLLSIHCFRVYDTEEASLVSTSC